ncbi:hypothetical protein JTB14_029196 [Gonioctena quinquepunctata]|nr:hypothetical protein JTB14_029196 [Gonioctena quinquepunctata]
MGMQMLGQQFYPPKNLDSRRTRVWIRNVECLRHVQEIHTYRGGTIMVWDGIIIGGRSDLVSPNGSLTGEQYVNGIRQPIVPILAGAVGENFRLMHDNARPHITVTNWLDNGGIEILPWPAQSPGLNPIEHMAQRGITSRMGNIHKAFRIRELLTT